VRCVRGLPLLAGRGGEKERWCWAPSNVALGRWFVGGREVRHYLFSLLAAMVAC
jgi:hypothetical protein